MKAMFTALEAARSNGRLRDVDVHLARHLVALDATATPPVALAVALLSRASADGDVCLDLRALAGRRLLDDAARPHEGIDAPPLDAWLAALHDSALVAAAGNAATAPAPLVLDAGHRLYLQKYFAYERAVVTALTARNAPPVDPSALETALARAFPGRGSDDAQRAAAATAARAPVTVITGGPGTGKTTTVTRLLALLLLLAGTGAPRIALAAPTGKAAARLGESVRGALAALRAEGLDDALLARIPAAGTTLHRLLGWQPDGFRHHADNPLPVDVLVVDEASMIDLPLMARLLAAVPAGARLVLLGDRDQLASVEAGNVLGDLCNRGEPGTLREDISLAIAVLTHSHRFRAGSGIGALARATRQGDVAAALAALESATDVTRRDLSAAALPALVAAEAVREFAQRPADPATALRAFNAFRFLCALREGPFGVDNVNRLVERELAARGLIDTRTQHYAGRPLLVTENDYGVGLYNGDTGLVLPDETGTLRAFFLQGDGTLRRVALNRLPAHETCYAMTVHKSQGSEFDRVTLVLPVTDSPVLGRELVYTGITRARQAVTLLATPDILTAAIGRATQRSSGLRDALWRH